MSTVSSPLAAFLHTHQQRVSAALDHWLPQNTVLPQRLHEAMRFSVLNGGKRVRPVLVYAAGHALGVPAQQLDGPACALELIHAYSLVHDDLPACAGANPLATSPLTRLPPSSPATHYSL